MTFWTYFIESTTNFFALKADDLVKIEITFLTLMSVLISLAVAFKKSAGKIENEVAAFIFFITAF